MLIVIPVCHKDIHLAKLNLDLCRTMGQSATHDCLISTERGTDTGELGGAADGLFRKVDRYEYEPYIGKKEWPAPQNYAWQSAARYIPNHYDSHWFWWEADVTPLRRDWLDRLDAAYREAGKPFMGHVVAGMGHLNGVAVYPNQIAYHAQQSMMVRSTPFDTMLSTEAKQQIHPANHLMAHHPRVNGVQLSVADKGVVRTLLDGSFVCFHGITDGSLAGLMKEHYEMDARAA